MHTLELMTLHVKDFMTKELVTLNANSTIDKAEDILNNNNIHHIPIVNDKGTLVGMVSREEINLLKDWGTRYGLRDSSKKNSTLLSSLLAEDIMQKELVTVSPDATLKTCAAIFRDNKFHSLPVVDENDLVGIITTYDLIIAAYKLPTRYNQVF